MVGGGKRTIHIDIVSDTVCPWCFIGKKRLDRAMEEYKDHVNFEVRWRPYQLNPTASKEGVEKSEYYAQKFGEARAKEMTKHMAELFKSMGLEFRSSGKTGSSLNSHRLLTWAADQGLDEQNRLAEALFRAYFCQEGFLNDRRVLLECAEKAGLSGAQEIIDNEELYLDKVHQELKEFGNGISGVPTFIIDNNYKISGAQDSSMFICMFGQLKDASE